MQQVRSILARAFPGCTVTETRELGGGISADATQCTVEVSPGVFERFVVRRPRALVHGTDRSVGTIERRVLPIARSAGIPVPKLEYFDEPTNALVLEYVAGSVDFSPIDLEHSVRCMAEALAAIHRVDPSAADLSFLTRRRDSAGASIERRPTTLDASLDEGRLRALIRGIWPWPEANPSVLLHGDYWPGNVVWNDHRVSAVIDWEESELGDPLADVALARLDLVWAFGDDAAEEFTRQYRSLSELDWTYLPHWDLCIALRPMSNLSHWAAAYSGPPIARPDIDEASMRAGHRRFVQRALASLGA